MRVVTDFGRQLACIALEGLPVISLSRIDFGSLQNLHPFRRDRPIRWNQAESRSDDVNVLRFRKGIRVRDLASEIQRTHERKCACNGDTFWRTVELRRLEARPRRHELFRAEAGETRRGEQENVAHW